MKSRAAKIASLLFQGRRWAVLIFQAVLVLASMLTAKWLSRPVLGQFDALSFRVALLLVGCRLLPLRFFGLHHGWWRYTGLSDAKDIAEAVAAGSLLFGVVIAVLFQPSPMPLGFYFLEPFFTAVLLMGVRLLSRAFAESVREDCSAKRVLIIGAGFGSQMLLREIRRPDSGYAAVACVDDDSSKLGMKILGCEVMGSVNDIPDLVRRLDAAEVLGAIPSATSSQMRRFVSICDSANVPFRTIPCMRDFLLDRATLGQMREVDFDDLLCREPVNVDLDSLRLEIADRIILVTGAAGSIGSEICRQLLTFDPAVLVCLDQNENGMFYLQQELSKLFPNSELVFVVGDVRDSASVRRLMTENGVQAIFHAAAYKHVPMMEHNVVEAVKNNVFGLMCLLQSARECKCESLILISSDKAVNPTSIMGATKRICELIMASFPAGRVRCVSVRFGNVLGSSGSLIPLLREQIRNGGPVTVTHPEIRRFFMTTKEAITLVLQAFAIGNHRDILVLDMGPSLRILDMAKTLIRLSGKSTEQIPIVFTGLRDGEKFCEEIFYDSERRIPSGFDKIERTEGRIGDWTHLQKSLRQLEALVENGCVDEIRDSIRQIVPEYSLGAKTLSTASVARASGL